MRGRGGRALDALTTYARIAWWGLLSPRFSEREPLLVLQAVVLGERGVLLGVRSDLRGWELPGGAPEPGETSEQALLRELREETGLEVEVIAHVGDYVRRGFRPHTARVYRCGVVRGELRASTETRALRWFDPATPPATLFPWYRQPLADALAGGSALIRSEHQGLGAIWAGLRIDLRMRLSDDRSGLPAGAEQKKAPNEVAGGARIPEADR